MERVEEGIWRVGSWLTNWYLVEEDGRLTVVDAGGPGYWPQLPEALETLGHSLTDVEAIVLTHADLDHRGFAERARRETGATVWVHEAEEGMARGGPRPASERALWEYAWRPAAVRSLAHFWRSGLKAEPVTELQTFADGDVLDAPGRPRIVHCPGHTPGSSAIHFPNAGVVMAGDIMCMLNPLTGSRGPQLLANGLNVDAAGAMAALDRFGGIGAEIVLSGHGEAWRHGAATAAERAREAGFS